jgi:hypothetical protein
MPWWQQIRANLDREGVGVRPQTLLTRHLFRECHGCEDDASNKQSTGNQGEPAAGLCGVDVVGSQAKPDQYGRRIRHLGDGAARAIGRQAFLTDTDSRMTRYGILSSRAPPQGSKNSFWQKLISYGDLAFPDRLAINAALDATDQTTTRPFTPLPSISQFGPA